MKKQYTVLFGPVCESELGELFLTKCKAPLIEVRLIPKTDLVKPKSNGGIVRHTVTESDVEKMLELRLQNKSDVQIALAIGCSAITVRRHAPKQRMREN